MKLSNRGFLARTVFALVLLLSPRCVLGETPEELKQLFDDLLASARSGDRATIAAMAQELAIPHVESWCRERWGDDAGAKIAAAQAQWSAGLPDRLQGLLQEWAGSADVQVATARIDDPRDARIPVGVQRALVAMRQPAPVFTVQFSRSGADSRATPGAFVFVEGGFRWFGDVPSGDSGDGSGPKPDPSGAKAPGTGPSGPDGTGGGAPGTGPAFPGGPGQPGDAPAAVEVRGTPPSDYPDSEEGLRAFLSGMLAAAEAADAPRLTGFAEALSRWQHDGWFRRAFGDERGASAARWYGLRIRDSVPQYLPPLVRQCVQDGATHVEVWSIAGADHPKAREVEREALALRKTELRLYGAALRSADGKGGIQLQSIVHVDGNFRLVSDFPGLRPAGKLMDLRPSDLVEEVRVLLLHGDTFPAAATHLVGQRIPTEQEMLGIRGMTFKFQAGDPFKPFERLRTGETLNFASLTVVNPTDQPVRSVRVEGVVPGFSESAVDTFSLGPKESRRVGITPLFQDKVFEGDADRPAALRLKVQFDGSVVFEKTYAFTLLPRKACVWDDPDYGSLAELIAVWVTPADEVVRLLASAAAERLPGRAIGGSMPAIQAGREQEGMEARKAFVAGIVKAVFEVLHASGIHYVNTPLGFGYQQIEYPAECVSHRAANCVEGAALMASVFEAVGLDPWITLSMKFGHSFVVVMIPTEKPGESYPMAIETTMIGEAETVTLETTDRGRMQVETWKAAILYGGQQFERWIKENAVMLVPVRGLHAMGVKPAPVRFPVPDWIKNPSSSARRPPTDGRRPTDRPPVQQEEPQPQRPDPAALSQIAGKMAQEAGWPPVAEQDRRIEAYRASLAQAFNQTLFAVQTAPWAGWRQEVLYGFFAVRREEEKLKQYTDYLRPWVTRREKERQMVARLEVLGRAGGKIVEQLRAMAVERGYPAEELDRDLGGR